eukprot:scaffold73378_cov63-Phaeocystis_antarctica.AAC.1
MAHRAFHGQLSDSSTLSMARSSDGGIVLTICSRSADGRGVCPSSVEGGSGSGTWSGACLKLPLAKRESSGSERSPEKSLIRPSLKSRRVGYEATPYRLHAPSASGRVQSTVPRRAPSRSISSRESHTGDSRLQCPHHGASNLTKRGVACSNAAAIDSASRLRPGPEAAAERAHARAISNEGRMSSSSTGSTARHRKTFLPDEQTRQEGASAGTEYVSAARTPERERGY